MSKRLSPKQVEALRALSAVDETCSRFLGFGLNMMLALEARNLAHGERGPGTFRHPDLSIHWSITPAGRAALAAQNLVTSPVTAD